MAIPAFNPGKSKINLWRAALYGALFMIAVRTLHTLVSTDAFLPSGPGGIAEFLGYLLPGVILFVGIAFIRNRVARSG